MARKRSWSFGGVALTKEGGVRDADGELRITKFKDGAVVGGDAESHGRIQDDGIRVQEALDAVQRRHGPRADVRHVRDAVEKAFGR